MVEQRVWQGCTILALLAALATADGDQGWRFSRIAESGGMYMKLHDRRGAVSCHVTLRVGNDGRAASAQVRFASGLSLEATPGELRYYWHYRQGLNAYWKYLRAQGELDVHELSDSASVLRSWFGQTVACVTKIGKHFVGTLQGTTGDARWFALKIEGAHAPVVFHVSAVSELHLPKKPGVR